MDMEKKARNAAAGFLLYKMYTCREIYDRLRRKGFEKELAELKSCKLVKIVDSDFMTQGYLTIEKFYSCPRCGETFGNVRFSRRSQLAEMYKFCYKCGQGLDWSETTKG